MVNRIPREVWNMDNVDDFKKWVTDNKSKSDEGCDAMKAVMEMGCDIASAAAVKWFRDEGKMKPDEVSAIVGEIADKIASSCAEGQESVIKDCASLFAGTGNPGMVMMIAFVSYSLIGVRVAASVMADHS